VLVGAAEKYAGGADQAVAGAGHVAELGEARAVAVGLEPVAPADPGLPDPEHERPAPFRLLDLRGRYPAHPASPVEADEQGADLGALALAQPAAAGALRAPVAHAGDVRHQVPHDLGAGVDAHGLPVHAHVVAR
jgi:hypothetical protein